MAWLWWQRYCCCCTRGQVRLDEDDDEEEEAVFGSNSTSQSSIDVNSSQDSEAMGNVFGHVAEQVTGFFHKKKKPASAQPASLSTARDERVLSRLTHDQSVPTVQDDPSDAAANLVDITVSYIDSEPIYPLATPRSSLRRGRTTTPSETTPEKPPFKRLKGDYQYLDYPVLKDEQTINFVFRSKVIFIMKGVQGSGKSFIVEKLKEVYREAVECSADHYFMQNGEYEFDRDKLKEAHEHCQLEATNAAKANYHVIIIDNTNIRNWEMKFYLDLAKEYRYIPLVLEPQTPWAKDASALAMKNYHSVTEEIVAQKIKSYQPVQPLYYGWFLNEMDSEKICEIGHNWLQQALNVEEFLRDLSENAQVFNPEEFSKYFSRDSFVDGGNIIHATANFTGRGKTPAARDYMNNSIVQAAMGQGFSLHIIGFVITPRTVGARLRLTDDQLVLWGNVDDENRPPNLIQPASPKKSNQQYFQENESSIADNGQDVPDGTSDGKPRFLKNKDKVIAGCSSTITENDLELTNDRFWPISGKGSRAHLTLACAPGIRPVNTGFDLIDVVQSEQKVKDKLTEQKVETFAISGGVLRNYGEGTWVIYPEREVIVSSMFSAFY